TIDVSSLSLARSSLSITIFVTAELCVFCAMRWRSLMMPRRPNNSTGIFLLTRITANYDASCTTSRAGFRPIKLRSRRCELELRGWLDFFELRNHLVGLIKFRLKHGIRCRESVNHRFGPFKIFLFALQAPSHRRAHKDRAKIGNLVGEFEC